MPKSSKQTQYFVHAKNFNVENVRISEDFGKPNENYMTAGSGISYIYPDGNKQPLRFAATLRCGGVNDNTKWLKDNNKTDDPTYHMSLLFDSHGGKNNEQNEKMEKNLVRFRKQLQALDNLIIDHIAEHAESKGIAKNALKETFKDLKKNKVTGKKRTSEIRKVLSKGGVYNKFVNEYTNEKEDSPNNGRTTYSCRMKLNYEIFGETGLPSAPSNLLVYSHKDLKTSVEYDNMKEFIDAFYYGAEIQVLFSLARFMDVGGKNIYLSSKLLQITEAEPRKNSFKNSVFAQDDSDEDDDDEEDGDNDNENDNTNDEEDDSDGNNDDDDDDDDDDDEEEETPPNKSDKSKNSKSNKKQEVEDSDDSDDSDDSNDSDDDDDDDDDDDNVADDDDDEEEPPKPTKKNSKNSKPSKKQKIVEEDDEEETPKPSKKNKKSKK